jgi:AraC family transcriptional regulator
MGKDETLDSYAGSVNRAIDYIDIHYAEPLTLDILAAEGRFSPYHFHRVFKAVVGETHQKYINRIRLEKAVHMMDSGDSLTDIALAVGFATSAHFAQSFRSFYGTTPRAFRMRRDAKVRKDSIVFLRAKPHTDFSVSEESAYELKEFPPIRIAYARHIGGYDFRIGFAWKKVMSWARKKGFLSGDSLRISCSWDDPELTENGKLRYEACVSIPDGIGAEGSIGTKTLDGGWYAVFPFDGKSDELPVFYDRVYGVLLPATGLRLRDDPCYRVHRESAADQIRGRFRNELRVPVFPR